jgi:SAM-dependent methyltransferase
VRVSVFTPLTAGGAPYIRETARSLTWQKTDGLEVEWIVLENHGGELPRECRGRLAKVVQAPEQMEGIGALKALACSYATGDVLVELDHDDLLVPGALAKIAGAVRSGADFVYSDVAYFHHGTWAPHRFSSVFGWASYPIWWSDPREPGVEHKLDAMRAPRPTPQNMRRVEWSPDHVRAWRTDFYRRIGGHEPVLPVADDHDLVVRTYMAGGNMVHIPECLYLYRLHDQQGTKLFNGDIQEWTARVYENNFPRMALRFAKLAGLRAIDLCGGINTAEGFEAADLSVGVDLDRRWPWADNSVGVLRANDALEHMHWPTHVMSEAYRVLAPGGIFLTHTPSTEGLGADCDPTHVSRWNELSFRYYTDPEVQQYIAHEFHETKPAPRFAQTLLRTVAADWDARVKYVDWHGIALKPGYHHMGACPMTWRAPYEQDPEEVTAPRPRHSATRRAVSAWRERR